VSDPTPKQLVVFSLGSEEYALPIGAVHEIIRYAEPRAVASSVPWIRGVIGLRGKIIPVYDLAARLGLAVAGPQPGKIVIASAAGGQAGVMVDDVEEVLTVGEEQLEDVPAATAEAIAAIARLGDRLVVLLDPEGLFARETGAEELAAA
jgi:purine-binding chemotaxis protein CheW